MEKIFLTRKNEKIPVYVPAPADLPSFFVFSLHKAGSTMLTGIVEKIGAHLQIPLISPAQAAYRQGCEEDDLTKDICSLFSDTGYGFYGFRYLPSYLAGFDLSKFKKILLIRDPRDILVSLYFSVIKSHRITVGEAGKQLLQERETATKIDIDEYVLHNAECFLNRFYAYRLIEDDRLKLYRYEDVIFCKRDWIQSILEFLNLELDENIVNDIVKSYDIFPNQEDPASHIRKVTPGDYKQKLKSSTIDRLNQQFSDILSHYGYQ
jgi:hypothetical protein